MAVNRKYELYSADFRRQSHQVYDSMRRDDPVFQQPGITGKVPIWFVTRYAEVEFVLLNDQTFVRDPFLALSPEEASGFMDNGDPRINAMINNHMLNKEGRITAGCARWSARPSRRA